MVLEPANTATDLVLTLVAFALAWQSARRQPGQRYWTAAFASGGISAGLGTVYHGGLKANSTWGFPTWTVITLWVAVTVSFMLAGTVATLVDAGRARVWLWLRMAGLLAFGVAAVTGHAGLETLLFTESLTMVAILGLWWRAWWHGDRGAGLVLLAMGMSAVAGVVRATPLTLEAGWVFPSTALYHLAQVPGLVLLAVGVGACRPDAVRARPAPRAASRRAVS